MLDDALLEIHELSVGFRRGWRAQPVRALDGVSMCIPRGKTVGLVGESGSGKTTLGRAILGIAPITSGSVTFQGESITHTSIRRRRQLAPYIQVVFQDSNGSLSPRLSVGASVAEPLRACKQLSPAKVRNEVDAVLERVGLPGSARRYPHEFSGGQRQRVAIARALVLRPRLVICDEVVSELDLSVRAQVLNLLADLQREYGLSYLFIAHNLSVVHYLSDWIVVIYRGRVMESGPATQIYNHPIHPYTRLLLSSEPAPLPVGDVRDNLRPVGRDAAKSTPRGGTDLGGSTTTVGGCPFATRCPVAIDICRSVRPNEAVTSDSRTVFCHLYNAVAPLIGSGDYAVNPG
jgi:peptide/nickel transport system ATP-binding protein